MIDKTIGLKNLQSILSERPEDSSHWNEAQNRFQFIDELLINCLGWVKSNIEVEERGDGGIADYSLGKPVSAILEAKKEVLVFKFPPISKNSKSTKLRNIYNFCDNAKNAIDQVFGYCSRRGVPLAIVCNGPQMIIFQTIVSGQPFLDMDCHFFDGIENYEDDFSTLWDFLSPNGLYEGIALSKLNLNRALVIPPKPSVVIANTFEKKPRNNFQENLNALCDLLLQSISGHEEIKPAFYKDCYVNLEANNRHLLLSKNIIENRYQRAAVPNNPYPLKKKIRRKYGDVPQIDIDPQLLMEASTAEPVVVLGDVGVGKSSFFENMYENTFRGRDEDIYFINIDLGSEASLSDDIKVHVLDSIFSQLLRKYSVDVFEDNFVRSIYHDEIDRFSKGIFGRLNKIGGMYESRLVGHLEDLTNKRDQHMHASLAHLANGRNKTIILVIDNADQRSFEVQQKAFLIAKEIASKKCSVVFIALRPSTFYRSKTKGAMSAYKSRFFTINPPPADQVIEKRISYALRIASGQIKPKSLEGIKLPFVDARNFLTSLLRSINDDDKIKMFLNNITGGNIRAVVELIAEFCGSPHLNSKKAVEVESETGNYKIPLHQITRHAILRDSKYFNAESSYVAMNLFDVDFADSKIHFLCPAIIAFMNSSSSVRDKDGFVTGANIIVEFTKHQFLDYQVRKCLQKLCEKRLIETPYSHHRDIEIDAEDPDRLHYRVTSIGTYHLQQWMSEFGYLEIMSIDTPIFDEEVSRKLTDLASSQTISARLEKAKLFKAYLKRQWQSSHITMSYFNLDSLLEFNSQTFDAAEKFSQKGKRRGSRFSR